jgi:hypothetical protein
MVDVTDGADVAVRLVPLEFSLTHLPNPRSFSSKLPGKPALKRASP